MIAIFTKYIGPSNVKGSRVKAYCKVARVINGTVTREWAPEWSAEQNHLQAAMDLAIKCAWSGNWYMGDAGDEYAFVRVPVSAENNKRDVNATFFVPYDRDAEAKRIETIMSA